MFCTNCGEPLTGRVKFCPHCGKGIDGNLYDAADGAAASPENEDTPTSSLIPLEAEGDVSPGDRSIYSAGDGSFGNAGADSGSGYSAGAGTYGNAGAGGSGYSAGAGGSGYSAGAGICGNAGAGSGGYNAGAGTYGNAGAGSGGYNAGAGTYGNTGAGSSGGYSTGFGAHAPNPSMEEGFTSPLDEEKTTFSKLVHIGSGFIGLLPLFMTVIGTVLGIFAGMNYSTGFWALGEAFEKLRKGVFVVLTIGAIVELGGILYLIASKKVSAGQGRNITLGVAVMTAIYAAFKSAGGGGFVRFLLWVGCTVLGLDLLGRFFTFGTALVGGFDLKGSIDILKEKAGVGQAGPKADAPAQGPVSQGGAAPFAGTGPYSAGQGVYSAGQGIYSAGSATYNNANGSWSRTAGSSDFVRGGQLGEDSHFVQRASFFDGTGGELFGHALLLALASVLTCGLAAPWFICRIYRWQKQHTVIDGRRLTFNGTGSQLFVQWIIWELLCVVTCGFFGFYVVVALKRWELNHTAYEGAPDLGSNPYPNSWFDGTFGSYLGYALLCGLVSYITCGIAYPWVAVPLFKWEKEGSVIDKERLGFFGNGGDLFGIYLVNAILTLITCGIYAPWAFCRVQHYLITNTHVIARY